MNADDRPGHDPLDTLSALAVLDDTELRVRPLDEVSRRAAGLRRARRLRTTGLSAAVAVALVAGVTSLLSGGGTATSTPATSGTSGTTRAPSPAPADCSRGTTVFAIGAHPELVHLVTATDAPPLGATYGLDLPGPPCSGLGDLVATAAVRARFSADGGEVTAGLVVTGPLDAAPWSAAGQDGPTPGVSPSEEPARSSSPDPRGLITEAVTVHGTRAVLRRWPSDSRALLTVGTAGVEWQEPATGKWWSVQSAGLSRDELLAVADGLGTNHDHLDEGTLPTDGWTAMPLPAGDGPGHRFDAEYLASGAHGVVQLSVSDVPEFGPELVGLVSPGSVKVADVNGARAFLRPIGLDGDSPSLQWAKGGLWFTLYASPDIPFEQLVTLARSVERVPADDPRILRAVATAPPNPYAEQPAPDGATAEATSAPTASRDAAAPTPTAG